MQSFNTFVAQSIKHFVKVGSLVPSSTFLAKRMTKGMKSQVVLELGPGTGVFTKEILRKLPSNGKLISIESNQSFVKYLKDKIKDKRLKICNGDALLLKKHLLDHGIKKVDVIISGLPIGNFKKEEKKRILDEIAECLEDDGTFIQFEYFLAGIMAVKKVFPKISISFELFNFPPAFVMRCKKIKK